MVSDTGLAIAFAVLCWWFSTGVILWLDRLPPSTFRWSLGAWTLLLALSFWGVDVSMRQESVLNAYLGFTSVIIMWGWHELAFLTGIITGPRKVPLQAGAVGVRRFIQSLQVVLHHELVLLLNFAILWWMQMGQANHIAICTFALLWCMRVSAKLNLFFGVRQSGSEYLPAHLSYLASYFPSRWITPWFLLSISLSILTWLWLVHHAQLASVAVTTNLVLLAALLGLAIVEHVVMLMPWTLEKIWGWAIASKSPTTMVNVPMRSE
jgi:putative photosynthetic complex assembly protein 2